MLLHTTAQIQSLAQELPYASGAAIKKKKIVFSNKGGHEFWENTIQPTTGAVCVFKGTMK